MSDGIVPVKKFGQVGVLQSATSPAGNIGLLFGFDYDRSGGKPHLAALLSWQDARKMAAHIIEVTQQYEDKAIADAAGKPVSSLASLGIGGKKKFDGNRPKEVPPGKELVRKPEPAQPAVRKRVRPAPAKAPVRKRGR